MKTEVQKKKLPPAHKAATLGFPNLSSQTDEEKREHIKILGQIRRMYRAEWDERLKSGYRAGALMAIWAIEAATPDHEKGWCPGTAEEELTDHDDRGTHLAITRLALGMIP